MADNDKQQLFSIVIPVYNNEYNIPYTVPYIIERLHLFKEYSVEIIMVCDGSPDGSWLQMKKMHQRYPGILRIVRFTRNFGQGAAIRCGIDLAEGDVIGVISCDLQDPFELFVDMLQAYEKGIHLVIAQRVQRHDGVNSLTSTLFHHIVHKYIDSSYPEGGFDFFIISRAVAEDFKRIDAPNGSTQMALLWLGYKEITIPYERNKREVGKSGWSIRKKAMAATGLFATYTPLLTRTWMSIGIFTMALSTVLYIISCALGGKVQMMIHDIWTFLILFSLGNLLCAIAATGEYIWRIYWQSLNRPRYIIAEQE